MRFEMGKNNQTPKKVRTSWLGLLALGGFVGVVGVFGTSRYPLCACGGPDSLGRGTTMGLHRAQQAYWLEHQRFADSIEALEVGIPAENRYYRYSVVASPTQAFVYGIPREPGYAYARQVYGFGLFSRTVRDKRLPSYVGAVFEIHPGATVSIFCSADEPELKRPAPPELRTGYAVCAKGTTALN